MKKLWQQLEWRITFFYVIFGVLWIFISDRLLAILVSDEARHLAFQNYKGWFFVTLSALLIFTTLRNAINKQRIAIQQQRVIQERFQNIFRTSMDAIILFDSDGSILAANPSACQIFGWTEEEMLKLGRDELVDETISARIAEHEENHGKGLFHGEILCVRKNGEKFPGEISSAYFEDRNGYKFNSAIIRDVTEKKRVEAELRDYNQRLEREVYSRTEELEKAHAMVLQREKMATFGTLSDGVAHELRNPLGVISNAVYYLKLILTDAEPKVNEYLQIMEHESQSAKQILSDLLNYANIQTGDRQVTHVMELLQRVLQQHPKPDGIITSIHFSESVKTFFIDAYLIETALGKLVDNAYQAMPEGGICTISAKRVRENGKPFVSISIFDNGSGIAEKDLPMIFEPLFTTKQHHIGLGLPICKRLIEMNGGRMEVKSKPGKGTTFIVLLPEKSETLQ